MSPPQTIDALRIEDLEQAARRGESGALAPLLEALPVKEQHRREWLAAALVGAAEGGHREAVALVLDRGADPNAALRGVPPLHAAAGRGALDIVRLLLDRGAARDGVDIIENTPLMCAVNGGHHETVRYLVDAGATLSHATTIGETALTTAIERGDAECIELLLEAGAPARGARPDSPRSPLRAAVREGRLELAQRLVAAGADVHAQSIDDGLAHLAARAGHLAILRWLADEGVALDGDYRPPIERAAEEGHIAIVRFLLERGQTLEPMTLLHGSARSGSLEGIRLALELGADVNGVHGYGETRALILAAAAGQPEAVALLLEVGADPNGENGRGETAMTRTHDEAVKRLLREAGALEDRLELVDAAEAGDRDQVCALLEGGARVDVAIEEYGDRRGLTPLMAAAAEGHEVVVRELLEAGAAPNRADDDGWSAVMHAADAGYAAVVERLIEAGADLLLKDRQQYTAHQLAGAAGHDAARVAIEAAGGHRDLRDELQEALYSDDAAAVVELFEAGLDPATALRSGEDLLARAAYDGRSAITRLLLDRAPDADVDRARVHGRTPLMSAAAHDDRDLAVRLLERGAEPTLGDDEGTTAFMHACGNHGHEVAALLLERGVVDDAQLSAGLRTCLDYPSPEVLALLLERGPILDAGDRRQVMAANLILEEGEDVAIRFGDDEEALRQAVMDGLAPLVSFLLAKGTAAVPSYPEDPPLIVEAAHHPAVVRVFAEAGQPLDGVLVRACERLYGPEDTESLPAELAELLLAHCPVDETDEAGRTPLMNAARAGHPMVERLLEAGADVSARSERGATALHEAAGAGHQETVRALLAAGASAAGLVLAAAASGDPDAVREAIALEKEAGVLDLERRDDAGWTAIAHAAATADEALLQELLDAGAVIDGAVLGAARSFEPSMIEHVLALGAPLEARDELGRTALHMAASEGALECVAALLAEGADAGAADRDGITVLMEAVDADAEDVARALIEAGADRRAKDADGRTAFDRVWAMAPRSLKQLVQP